MNIPTIGTISKVNECYIRHQVYPVKIPQCPLLAHKA